MITKQKRVPIKVIKKKCLRCVKYSASRRPVFLDEPATRVRVLRVGRDTRAQTAATTRPRPASRPRVRHCRHITSCYAK